LSGVLMPMEVGELSHWASYAFAAAMLAPLPLPLLAVALLVLPLLLLVLPLLLHAAIASAEAAAMTAAAIFLIRAFILADARSTGRWTLALSQVSVRLLSWFSTVGFRRTVCLEATRTEAKMLCTVPGGRAMPFPGPRPTGV
jgi:hypothetical protein